MYSKITYVLFGLWFTLCIGSLITIFLFKNKSKHDRLNLLYRIKSWIIFFAIFTFAVNVNYIFFILIFSVVSALALREFFSIVKIPHNHLLVKYCAYLAIPCQYYFIYKSWYLAFLLFIPLYMFILIPSCLIFTAQTNNFLKTIAITQWGLLSTVYSLSHAPFLLTEAPKTYQQIVSIGLIMYLVLLTELNDIAQYFWGKCLGKHKITPQISPHKTWEGFIGGLITIIVFAIVLYRIITPFSLIDAILSGTIISIGGFIGDIIFSAIKRDLQIKDSGKLIPGQGGILDRFDSMIVVAPLFFYFVHFLSI